jgi:DNA-binding beta-propeller fold protein YncE
MKKLLVVGVLFALAACTSSVQDLTEPAPDTTPQEEAVVSPTHPADVSIPLGKTAVVAATNWTDPVGSLASLDIADYTASTALVTTDGSDVVLKSFFDKIYVISRFGTDTIQVVNPEGFGIVADYSVGAGSNPQDIWVVSEEKAYVSRLDAQNDTSDASDVLIINPLTGEKLGSLDFKSYMNDDGDRLSRAAQMVAVGNKLFISLQDLSTNLLDKANAPGKVAVVDMDTDEILKVIILAGRNPADITYSPLTKLVYVSDGGVFDNFATDVTDPYGGIEVIDPDTLESKGVVIDDKDLGGYVQAIRLASDTAGYAIVGGLAIAEFNPSTYEVVNSAFYTTTGFYLPDFSLDNKGNMYVCDAAIGNAGIIVIDSAGVRLAGPVAVGAPPTSITFAGYEE